MQHFVTLISSPHDPQVDDALVRAVAGLLDGEARTDWLDPEIACDIAGDLPSEGTSWLEAEITGLIDGRTVDFAVMPGDFRRKALLVADMDSTLIGQECIDELADVVGIKSHVAAITERAMRGEIAFEPAVRERVALLAGLSEDVIGTVIEERVRLTPGAATLVATMRAHGAYCAIVSGGFTQFTGHVAQVLGFDEHRANRLLAEDGKLVGKVAEPILAADAKRRRLEELTAEHGLDPRATLAVGDGANDLDMIRVAGLGVAYHAKPVVAAEAAARIDHCDLSALLHLQGYRRDEFVDAS